MRLRQTFFHGERRFVGTALNESPSPPIPIKIMATDEFEEEGEASSYDSAAEYREWTFWRRITKDGRRHSFTSVDEEDAGLQRRRQRRSRSDHKVTFVEPTGPKADTSLMFSMED